MNIHELKALSFSEALSVLEESVVSAKLDIDLAKANFDNTEKIAVIAAKLEEEQQQASEKMAFLLKEKSIDLSGQNDTIMIEIIDILDSISEGIQKMLGLI